jgi:phosphoribosylpyrophosphate synthetase
VTHACTRLHAGKTIGASYKLEYGEDRIEMHLGHVTAGQRVVLIDDLIATGGTLAAGISLIHQVKACCLLQSPVLLLFHARITACMSCHSMQRDAASACVSWDVAQRPAQARQGVMAAC